MVKSGSKISISGSLIILIALKYLTFASFRPNRVLTGINLYARELYGSIFFVLLFLSILIFVLIFWNHEKYRMIIAILTFLIFMLGIYFLGVAAGNEIYISQPNGRMSLGGGFWLLMVGIFMIISGSFKEYEKAVLHRRVFYMAIFLVILLFLAGGYLDHLSIMKEFYSRSEVFFQQIRRHFFLSFFSVVLGVFFGIPTGVYLYQKRKPNSLILFLLNLGQTIPTLSFLGLVMVPFTFFSEKSEFLRDIGIRGVGFAPALTVLFIYALFPIVHNTIAGLKLVDDNLLEIASGMGMKRNQTFWKIQFPLSLPVVFGGIRTAMTQSIGNTILAGLIGGGGLGSIIFLGLAQSASDLILLGIIPLIVMAFMLDSLITFFIYIYKKRYLGLML